MSLRLVDYRVQQVALTFTCNVVGEGATIPAVQLTTKAQFGAALRNERGERTLREVAAKVDCNFTWLSKVENGHDMPSWEALKNLLTIYGVKQFSEWAYWHLKLTKNEQFVLAAKYIIDLSPL